MTTNSKILNALNTRSHTTFLMHTYTHLSSRFSFYMSVLTQLSSAEYPFHLIFCVCSLSLFSLLVSLSEVDDQSLSPVLLNFHSSTPDSRQTPGGPQTNIWLGCQQIKNGGWTPGLHLDFARQHGLMTWPGHMTTTCNKVTTTHVKMTMRLTTSHYCLSIPLPFTIPLPFIIPLLFNIKCFK